MNSATTAVTRRKPAIGLLREYQISPSKLEKLWESFEGVLSNSAHLRELYFGKPTGRVGYDFLARNIIYARNFGKYGKTIDDPQEVLRNLPWVLQLEISPDDIGCYMDRLARQYLPGYEANSGEYFVRLPRGTTAQQSETPFPSVGEKLVIYRRKIAKTLTVLDVTRVRKATASIKTRLERLDNLT